MLTDQARGELFVWSYAGRQLSGVVEEFGAPEVVQSIGRTDRLAAFTFKKGYCRFTLQADHDPSAGRLGEFQSWRANGKGSVTGGCNVVG